MESKEQGRKWGAWISDPWRPPLRRFEWLVMRLLLAWPLWHAVVVRVPEHWTTRSQPHGFARWIDLSFAADPSFQSWWIPAMIACLVAYVLGLLPIVATLGLLLGQVMTGTLGNSLGAIHHTGQVVALVLLGQLIAHLVHLVRRGDDVDDAPGARLLRRIRRYYVDWAGALTRPGAALLDPADRESQPHHHWVRFSQQFLAATYVASAISKLLASKGEWIAQVPGIALQFEKTRWSGYYDELVHRSSDWGARAAELVAAHPNAAKVFFGGGLFLELFCFLALIGRRMSFLFGLGLVLLHVVVSHLMGLGFAYHKLLLAIFFLNLPFWIWWLLRGRRRTEVGD